MPRASKEQKRRNMERHARNRENMAKYYSPEEVQARRLDKSLSKLARDYDRKVEKLRKEIGKKTDLPGLYALAETACDPKEVRAVLLAEAKRLAAEGLRRQEVEDLLNAYLDQHHFSGFQRKKTVVWAAKRATERHWKRRRSRHVSKRIRRNS